MNDKQRRFRELLIESVNEHFKEYQLPENTPIMLSGGTDSTTLLFAMLESGRRPPCYTFQLGQRDNNDVRSAKRLTEHFKLEWHLVSMPDDEHTLEQDVRELVHTVPPIKTLVQVCHPMTYLGPRLAADGHTSVLGAITADAIYGSGQQMQRLYRKEGEAAFNALRQKAIDNVQLGDSSEYIEIVLAHWGVAYYDVMNYYPLKEHCRNFTYKELWQGSKKLLPIMAFEDYYRQGRFVREPSPFQIESGIREWHDTLLKSPLNVNGRKEVAALYRDMRNAPP